jgi:hypothetical protein
MDKINSRPVILIIAGLLMVATLGLASVYTLIFPGMINSRTSGLEHRMEGLEANLSTVKGEIIILRRAYTNSPNNLQPPLPKGAYGWV